MIKTVEPFDVIAQSDCWCLITPENQNTETYPIHTSLTTLPPISELRITFPCDQDCDLPFSTALGILSSELIYATKLYPNPTNNFLKVNTIHSFPLNVRLVNMLGTKISTFHLQSSDDKIDLSKFPKGLYVVEISDENNRRIRTTKVVKE